jgi:hypothetical protein
MLNSGAVVELVATPSGEDFKYNQHRSRMFRTEHTGMMDLIDQVQLHASVNGEMLEALQNTTLGLYSLLKSSSLDLLRFIRGGVVETALSSYILGTYTNVTTPAFATQIAEDEWKIIIGLSARDVPRVVMQQVDSANDVRKLHHVPCQRTLDTLFSPYFPDCISRLTSEYLEGGIEPTCAATYRGYVVDSNWRNTIASTSRWITPVATEYMLDITSSIVTWMFPQSHMLVMLMGIVGYTTNSTYPVVCVDLLQSIRMEVLNGLVLFDDEAWTWLGNDQPGVGSRDGIYTRTWSTKIHNNIEWFSPNRIDDLCMTMRVNMDAAKRCDITRLKIIFIDKAVCDVSGGSIQPRFT